MSIRTLPQPTGGDFSPPPSGNHPARCYRVIDLGTQMVEFQGDRKQQHKVLVSWELMTDERMDDGRRFTIHQRYTFSTHEKAKFRQDLESWRGRAFSEADFGTFDIRKLLNVPCFINVVHAGRNGRTYANLAGVTPVPKGFDVPSLENPIAFLSLDKDDFDAEVFNALSDGLKDTIKKSPEFSEIKHLLPQENGYHAPDSDWQHPGNEPPPPNGEDDYGGSSSLDVPF